MNTKINKKEITFSDDAEAFFEKVTSACKAMTPLELDKVLEEMGLTVIEEEGKENKEEELKLKVKKLEAELKEEKWHWANADELLDIYRAKVDKLEAMIMKNR
jgi:hypothetical protein